MDDFLFAIECPTCERRLLVRDEAVIGALLICPKCGSMVHVVPPPDWKPSGSPAAAGNGASAPAVAAPATVPAAPTTPPPTEALPAARLAPRAARPNVPQAPAEVRPAPPKSGPSASGIVRAEPLRDDPPSRQPPPGNKPSTATAANKPAAKASPAGGKPAEVKSSAAKRAAAVMPLAATAVPTNVIPAPSAAADLPPLPPLPEPPAATGAAAPPVLTPSPIAPPPVLPPPAAAAPAAVASSLKGKVLAVLGGLWKSSLGMTIAGGLTGLVIGVGMMVLFASRPQAADESTAASSDDASQPAAEPAPPEKPPAQSASPPKAAAVETAPQPPPAVAEKPPATSPAPVPESPAPKAPAVASVAPPPSPEPTRPPGQPVSPGQVPNPERPSGAASPGEELVDETADNQERPPDVESRLQDTLAGLKLTEMPLADAVTLLSRLSTVPITFDEDGVADLGATVRQGVSIELGETTLGAALKATVAPCGLACVVEKETGQLLLTSPQRAAPREKTVRYDVAGLVDSPPGPDPADRIRKLVAPQTWEGGGGKGTARLSGNTLEVTQSESVHRQVATLLARLKAARAGAAASDERLLLRTRFDRAKDALRGEVSANFPPATPLTTILSYLEKASQTRILVNYAALAQQGIGLKAQSALDARGLPLAKALVAALRPLGLTYRILDERTLMVTTRDDAAARLDVEFYPVAGLIATKAATPESLVQRIRSQVAVDTWTAPGGQALIEFDPPSATLIVRQTQPAQVQIELLLAQLTRDAIAKKPAR